MQFLLGSFFPSHSMIPFQYVPEIFGVFFLKFSSHGLVFLFFQLFANRMTRGQECTGCFPRIWHGRLLLILVGKPDFVNVDGEV